MSEWWTYTLADFLMFSSRSYWRMIGRYNEALWPWQLLALAAGALIVWCVLRSSLVARRGAMLVLAAAWAWVAWGYQLQWHAEISTGAPYFAGAFALQALLLLTIGWRGSDARAGRVANRLGLGIASLAVCAYPLLAPVGARSWREAEVFAIAPDPTALATLGVLLALRSHWLAWIIPLAWCAVSTATLAELRVAHAWLPMVLAVAAVATGIASRR